MITPAPGVVRTGLMTLVEDIRGTDRRGNLSKKYDD